MPTDYGLLEQQVTALLADEPNWLANAANFAAFIYTSLPNVNWAGFYFPERSGDLVLGPFGGKPACARLGARRGVCGAAFAQRRTVVVDDVGAFADHIACDSASQSEIVVPLLRSNACYGVFDIDAPVKRRFSNGDRIGIERLVHAFTANVELPESYRFTDAIRM